MPLPRVKTIKRIEIVFQAPIGSCGIRRWRPKSVEVRVPPLGRECLFEDGDDERAGGALQDSHQQHRESSYCEDRPVRFQVL